MGIILFSANSMILWVPQKDYRETSHLKVLWAVQATWVFFVIAFGWLGYMLYGPYTSHIYLTSMEAHRFSQICQLGWLVQIIGSIPQQVDPFFIALTNFRAMQNFWVQILLKVLVMALIALLSTTFSRSELFLQLFGSIGGAFELMILPAAMYIALYKNDSSPETQQMIIFNVAFILLGAFFGIWGTVDALINIIK